MKIRPARSRSPNKKKTWKRKRNHQIEPISGLERLYGVLDHNDGGSGDQLSHPFCNLIGLKCLRRLLARVPDSSEIAQ